MSRLTIAPSESCNRALEEASAQRDKTVGQLIDESLDFYGVKPRQDLRDLALTDIAERMMVLVPVVAPPAPDPGDQLLWELLAAKADLVLLTGDKLLLRAAGLQARVTSPSEFVAAAS